MTKKKWSCCWLVASQVSLYRLEGLYRLNVPVINSLSLSLGCEVIPVRCVVVVVVVVVVVASWLKRMIVVDTYPTTMRRF